MDKNLYWTQSLNVAAYFEMKGIDLQFHMTDEKGVTTFYFIRSDKTKKAIEEYNSNKELKQFIYSYKKIKDLCSKHR